MYIVWRGSDKSPIDPLHAEPASDFARSDAQNPTTWLSWNVATAYAQSLGLGYGVGVVIHEGCGLLCVDIDGCIGPGGMSPLAVQLIRDARTHCPDVYVEISMSGRGVHIIGPYGGAPPPHSTKNQEHKIELYTARRYIALTGVLCPAT
jgi:primase-polymerase (primpol)-like protein